MAEGIEKIFNELVKQVAGINTVNAIGLSGKLKPYPKPGEGDFDIFIYCDIVPNEQIRKKYLETLGDEIKDIKLSVFNNEAWGLSDYCTINGIDTWLMFFNKNHVIRNVQEILTGKYLERADNYFFPIGRLGMLESLTVLYDKDKFLEELKRALSLYPKTLKEKMIAYNLEVLNDVEDLLRAVKRKDVLFYHFALDIALDHFLLALFAMNETYFPSRKRSLQYIDKFEIKPSRCTERLLSILQDGANANTLINSYEEFRQLCKELLELIRK
ncbi:DUF4037 domain-containing protein [Vallitalea okinawensis]|uniref:DUF4037 domain-containing protein n=1 Tax=Vallitalea okinawensis TaxID=2078660 RepID=UPI001300BC78|nr:DUF4037 domain-containing protein [Vallitalea okinawensis]